ncbi:MAG: bifunctional diguanylate cyclase/phosphodiesterase [Ruminococcaceae bacterium]|nr:bifunctional diguanylate cyclase/phosphodiesterase [Oscillospiraceae bacterium]
MEEKLIENEYRFKEDEFDCLEQLRTPLAVFQFLDKRVVTRIVSAGFCDLFEFDSREEAYTVMNTDIYNGTAHPDDAARLADAAYRFATEGGILEIVYRVKARKSSGYKIVHAIGEHVYAETGERLAYVWYTDEGSYAASDDEQKTLLSEAFRHALREESMLRENYYDYLTGLPNMSHFFDLVEAGRKAARQNGETPAVLFLDVNGMRFFNQKHGFAEGDKLLVGIAKVLIKYFKSENCSRFGQDHFAVFTRAEGLEGTLRAVIRECEAGNGGQGITIRIGVYPDRMGDVEASTACDRARHACDTLADGSSTSGFCVFDKSMLEELEKQQYFVENLDRALEEHWIQVYYQPIVRAVNGRVCDEESLSRWIDPEKGMFYPTDFVSKLEDAKLAYRLDLYVLEQTLDKLRRQKEAGLHLVPQSINLSRTDFDVCDIVSEIADRVDAAGIDRKLLSIEVTESMVGSDFEFMKSQVERFQNLGFEVWMDDFGSGYSSLDVLQNIHFDLIKFDMLFMERFNERAESRIILTELIRMAIGLGVDTICEGVESEEQVDFLREIGCTKLQGYHFCRPISLEALLERYRTGKQIGFENPEESDYYATIGRLNLYDTSSIANEEQQKSLRPYFDSIPMALVESTDESFSIVRCNRTYHDFMRKNFGVIRVGEKLPYADAMGPNSLGAMNAVRQCAAEGGQIVIDEEMANGSTVHAIVKRVAVNPVSGASTMAIAVLAVLDKKRENAGLTYANVAKALSIDYIDLYYVNLDTERFVHYSSDAHQRDLTMERHGEDFFRVAREEARMVLFEEDLEFFLDTFTRDVVMSEMDTEGSFTLTYRILMNGRPTYVNMKAVRMGGDDSHIIIGVNNVDTRMREREAMQRVRSEHRVYARIMTLLEDYVCIYTVDPATDRYTEYGATSAYRKLGIARVGDAFFDTARSHAARIVCEDDREMFFSLFTKENVLASIRSDGRFSMQYRLLVDGRPMRVRIKAVLSEEKQGKQLIFGVTDLDARR